MRTAIRCAFKLFAVSFASLWAGNAFAQAVATCSNPEGYAYYHHSAHVPKKESGFQKDKISGGLITLQRLANGDFDILFVDTRKQITSSRQDGGTVILLRRGAKDATFLVGYEGKSLELYTFYTDADNVRRFDLLQSRGGDALIHKSSLMSGICSEIDLHLIR